ncbi:MAG: VanW family protein [Clostridia bacterium]|nr:VanW family protein [Clostridia bacterium]
MKAIKTLTILAIAFTAIAFFNIKASALELSLTVNANGKVFEFYGEEIGVYKGRYYLKCIDGVIDGIYYDTLTPPVNATVSFKGGVSPQFTYTSEKNGYGIDKQKLKKDIDFALNGGNLNACAEFIKIPPETTKKDLEKCSFLRATFKTDYTLSSENRKHNIKLATSKINGTILSSGQAFSFNQIVGERTEQNGFKNAVVIENGEYVNGVGGGVCQVSTTLYNCALLSGLKTTERHAHTLLPTYVEPSFDAMVLDRFCDLKFLNDSGGTVFISAYTQGDSVCFSIYGLKPVYSYELSHVILSETPPPTPETTFDSELFEGQTVIIKTPKNAVKSEGYIKTLLNGKVIKSVKLHTDNYKSVQGKIKIGVKKREQEITGDNLIDKLAV